MLRRRSVPMLTHVYRAEGEVSLHKKLVTLNGIISSVYIPKVNPEVPEKLSKSLKTSQVFITDLRQKEHRVRG